MYRLQVTSTDGTQHVTNLDTFAELSAAINDALDSPTFYRYVVSGR